ncbi:hypothetical protein [Fodinibius sediminis]|uniref:N-acetyltransferase domain-containing protein n=1 Tax=Fodinibius sediminis TaxID=1214077 RepID=A0A521CA81_9BACT|nr:hypothetical protein [Fodinibius sediminis]SMO56349.1 hypothetical protein SAMN06265218_105192 [Fodinibius sediminis]
MSYDFECVESREQVKAFHQLPFRIYEDYPNWAPPFQFEIENIFNREQNPFFEKGQCERYLVRNKGRVVARFAVMNNPPRDEVLEPTMGGIGFLELENDQQLARSIIDFAEAWHYDHGYRAMRGPVNFGENDTYWGLLVENYDEPPIYGMFYHPPYYKQLLEHTGAEKLDDHWSYKRNFDQPVPERMKRITDRIEGRANVSLRPIDMNEIHRDAEYIREIYNEAWSSQDIDQREEEFTELTRDTVRQMVKKLKPVMIPESVLIAFVDDEPASFIVCVPDLNEISKETGGRLRWWHYPKLLWFKRRAKHLRSLVYGTKPKFRKMGLEALTFTRGIQFTKEAAPSLEYLEGAWVSEKNWLMQRSLEALGCHHHKTHRTYKWEF